ncbi:unnamed protein product [Linum tenue]|uniref:Uncharacterized protein n=1 Tax=Linum tenue TaxID=586396 RepID=A0AAV0Q2L0_9ROSI|nr:unnamed protein product [Linum tenue]
MENKIMLTGLVVMLISLDSVPASVYGEADLDTYIVFLQKPEGLSLLADGELDSWYSTFLPDTLLASSSTTRLIHSYRNVATGFAAKLTKEEMKAMEKKDGFISAQRERMYSLHTTRTPGFLGLQLNTGLWNGSNNGKGVIIGVLDTGVTPNHPSFNDMHMPSPPAKWKGKCQLPKCNNKLIGARNLVSDSYAIDDEGHGTHTSSTAAGSPVWASAFGQASGVAFGMAPLAHIAIYKVCSEEGCTGGAILAGMDAAAADGVHVLSLSLGLPSESFPDDPIAVGAFRAIQKGIFVSCSAGNAGPASASSANEAPWILTVGARANGRAVSRFCVPGSLYKSVRGKIVLCERGGEIARIAKGQELKDNDGAAMILMNDQQSGFDTLADAHVLPASHVSFSAGVAIKAYLNSTKSPKATILFNGTIFGNPNAPMVASFSSRGPSRASPGILKPDIIGPGPNDYIPYLCGLGYKESVILGILQRKAHCGNSSIPEAQLNYPSFSIRLASTPLTFLRTVTNVGRANSVYVAKVVLPRGVDVKVHPKKIVFNRLKQKATFTVTFTSKGKSAESYSQGFLYWLTQGYVVKSPIAVVSG